MKVQFWIGTTPIYTHKQQQQKKHSFSQNRYYFMPNGTSWIPPRRFGSFDLQDSTYEFNYCFCSNFIYFLMAVMFTILEKACLEQAFYFNN